MPLSQQQEEALFRAAVELPANKRTAFLDAACEEDTVARQRLDSRLAAHDKPEGKPNNPAELVKTIKLELGDAADEAVGLSFGRYKLLEKLGEGGFGAVWLAEQKEPVRRRVALKIIKLGMDTKAVVARFEAERQALAMMDHPNIAKVLDAGTTEMGRPYFVMELVRGIKITDYCDQAQCSTKERLDLFIKVCQAIQHAHQKGIIHRDIKPSNILVTMHDGVPVPKVIDFGIAKATQGELTDKTIHTQFQQFIGTPAYMSPEQAEMSGLDIDTRSDIYSLGVLLYEMLVGSTPFDAKELMSQGIDAMRKTIREKEPVRPSTKLAKLGVDELTTAARRRSADTAKLLHQLRGDLDWIVIKCLEKDRQRRYDTANGLAADLKRHLNNEPVLARPPSAAYKFQKALRRNKLAFAAGAGIAAALILGVIGTTLGLLRAEKQRQAAQEAQKLALQSRGEAEKLSNFMLDDFYTELEPSGQYETVADLAKKALAYYDGLPASLRTTETDRNRALALARLALVTVRQGDFKTSMPMAQEAADKLDQMRLQGDRSDGTISALGLALDAEYWCYAYQADVQSSKGPLLRGIEILRPFATSTDGSTKVILVYVDLLNYLSHFQPPAQAIATCEEALHLLAGIGALELSNLTAASKWADIADSEAREAFEIGRLDDAEQLEKQMAALAERVLARRPSELLARMDLSFSPELLTLIEASRFHEDAALRMAMQSRQAVEDYLRFNASDAHGWGDLGIADQSIAALLFRQGRVAEALQKARSAIESYRDPADTGAAELMTARFESTVARWEAQRGDRGAADQALQEAQRCFGIVDVKYRTPEIMKENHTAGLEFDERQVRLAFDEEATVYTMAINALPRLDKLKGQDGSTVVLRLYQERAFDDAARAALNLGRFVEAESAARALISLPPAIGAYSIHARSLDHPDDKVWGCVLLAQAQAGQRHDAEALKTLEPALARYRDAQIQGATYLDFRQHFARALYVQALAEPADSGGIARRSEALNQATALLQGLTDEARQLHDSKQLLAMITAAQKN